ncbi:hypothetical protein FOA43_002239 [Brettanomyces nanus]|uniref:TauD/TfdA-like domain-containing protein n=1 Tax=Eeniella nana TaxID=13502 RepID=A0A875RZE2_EENNA|nr:uncharacterized protein FOA43_002239 [Brettanomyces nanus]QPG74901.1 hypothetical protein FOA43_002239 [Brettanomyces nanus]
MPGVTVSPLNRAFGAKITLPSYTNDPSKLNEEDFEELKKALLTYSVLVVPNQAGLSPESQYALTVRFDPTTGAHYGHDEKIFHSPLSVLAKDGKCVPRRPEVMMVGNGTFPAGHEGMKEFSLEHPSQSTFHKKVLTEEEIANHHTRFYRWHIDAALYEFSPPVVTTLLGVIVPPKTEKQVIYYEDSDEKLEVFTGATAFTSGKVAFSLLSEEDKKFALNTTVVYAPHPYIYIHNCRATSDGLTMVSEGKEMPLDKLPHWEESKLKKLPMVWTNPITGNPHLEFHSCCVYRLVNSTTGETVAELEKAREICHRLMRPAISPDHVYAHAWTEGDLCFFHNRGVIHSVTGEMPKDEKRLMHQCNVASGKDPK